MAPHSDSGSEDQAERLPASLVVLPLRNQVIFPFVRGSFELPKKTFEEVCDHMERTGASVVGVVATRRPGKKGSPPDLYEVGTVCRLVSHAAAGTSGGGAEGGETAAPSGGGGGGGPRVRVVVEGTTRFRIRGYTQLEPLRLASVELLEEQTQDGPEAPDQDVAVRALSHSIREKLGEMLRGGSVQDGGKGSGASPRQQLRLPSSPSALAGLVGATLAQLSVEERQTVLQTANVKEQLELALDFLQREAEAKRMSGEISSGIQKSRELELRQVVLQRQIQEVQKDLRRIHDKAKSSESGEESTGASGEDEAEDEVARLADRLAKARLPEEADKIAKREIRRLKSLQPHHPEYTSTHTYLDTMASLPWAISSGDRFDLSRAKTLLDEDHKGLHQVKRRLLEFLAVQKLRGDMKGPILCLHGPPGIGKTSLGRSVARALGRKFHRIALGGVKDEAEIRGHRRTYIGSMPGTIIQAMQALGTNNPVILLDEVDKMTQNSMFNPQATLLEVLDPEQNGTFKDHYLNTPFDLSRVLFICTANDASLIDRPLLDRMEVIELSGYTLEEKFAITESHLLPKQRRLHALEPEKPHEEVVAEGQSELAPQATETQEPRLVLTQEAVNTLITKWTAESGVRSLERRLAQICRWATLRLQGLDVPGGAASMHTPEREAALSSCGPDSHGVVTVDAHHLPDIIGAELFEPDLAERLCVGVAMGLSVSSVGGNLLFIEATKTKGSGRLMITGQLGKVMSESVETALSLLRSRFVRSGRGYGSSAINGSSEVLALLYSKKAPGDSEADANADVDRDPFKGEDVHVHFPAGGIPKDGPSAGVAVLLALASVLLDKPMRSDTAVTGEVTLRGHVLPVGGIRDKVLAAHRAGVKHVLLPLANKRHVLEDIPAKTLEGIQVHYMKHIDEALDWAFGKPGTPDAEVEALRQHDLGPGVPAAVSAQSLAARSPPSAAAGAAAGGVAFVAPGRARL